MATPLNALTTYIPKGEARPASGAPDIATPPNTVAVEKLNVQHPEYKAQKETWESLAVLYTGGAVIKRVAFNFLKKRPKELPEVYNIRCDRLTYQNILGSGVDWYLASVFETDPEVDFKTLAADGSTVDADPDVETKLFYNNFQKNCDRKGTAYVDFWRDVLKNLLLYQCSWVLMDLPRPDTPPQSLKEQEQMGLLDPYLINYPPINVINWSDDAYGNLQWVVFSLTTQEQVWLDEPYQIERWYYFDTTTFKVYERRYQDNKGQKPQVATLVDSGQHSLASQQRVPVTRVRVPEGLWLANRVYPQVLDHLNADNAYSFALLMSNLAMPVLIGKMNGTVTLSEAGFIQLPEGSQIAWTEPPGGSFQRMEMRIASLREEIYRQMYLMAQGRDATATATAMSGYSKQLDMVPAGDIQNCFGDVLRTSMESVLDDVSLVREDGIQFSVRGFNFVETPAQEEIQAAMAFGQVVVDSPTAIKENQKKVVTVRFKDMSESMRQTIFDEIDKAPTAEEKMAQQQEQQAQQMQDQFQLKAKHELALVDKKAAANG